MNNSHPQLVRADSDEWSIDTTFKRLEKIRRQLSQIHRGSNSRHLTSLVETALMQSIHLGDTLDAIKIKMISRPPPIPPRPSTFVSHSQVISETKIQVSTTSTTTSSTSYYSQCKFDEAIARSLLQDELATSIAPTQPRSTPQAEPCPVCYEPLTTGIYRTPCLHSFHSTCISQWRQQRNTCPLCRTSLD